MKGRFWSRLGRAISGHWEPEEIDIPSERVILAALNWYEVHEEPLGPAHLRGETRAFLIQAVREYLQSRDQL